MAVTGNVEIYGRSEANTTLRQIGQPPSMNGIFTVADGRLKLDNLTIRDGRTRLDGAGIWIQRPTSRLELSNVSLINNRADQYGGGLVVGQGTADLENVTFSGNSATFGGALYNLAGGGRVVEGWCVDFVLNSATQTGGAVYNATSTGGTLRLRNGAFRSNTASTGGVSNHARSIVTSSATINATSNFWNNPTVVVSTNAQGVNTSSQLGARPSCPRAAPRAIPPAPPVSCRVVATVAEANVRATPNGLVIGLLFQGQSIVVVGKQTGWYQFFAGDVEHWISEQVVTQNLSGACDLLSGPVTLNALTPQNSGVYCFHALTPADALTNCREKIYNSVRLVYNEFSNRLGRPPTIIEVTGITMQLEWWTSIEEDPDIQPYGTEGLSRNYFQQCGLDGCNELETLYFLSGYQPWYIGNDGLTETVNEIESSYTIISSDLANPSSARFAAVNLILNPTDSAWRNGKLDRDAPWQWFNRDTSDSRPEIGSSPCGQVLLRIVHIPFEMYTAGQTDSINEETC